MRAASAEEAAKGPHCRRTRPSRRRSRPWPVPGPGPRHGRRPLPRRCRPRTAARRRGRNGTRRGGGLMATLTATPDRVGLPGLLRHRAVGKLVLLAVAAAVLVPLPTPTGRAAVWPQALTVDLSKPLTGVSDWDHRQPGQPSPVPLLLRLHQQRGRTVRTRRLPRAARRGLGRCDAAAGLLAWRLPVCASPSARRPPFSPAVCSACGSPPCRRWRSWWSRCSSRSCSVCCSVSRRACPTVRFRALRPVLDTMQVLPAFAYLLPWSSSSASGTGRRPRHRRVRGPPMARLTALGLRGADHEVLEAVASLGTTARQRLFTARLPLARRECSSASTRRS